MFHKTIIKFAVALWALIVALACSYMINEMIGFIYKVCFKYDIKSIVWSLCFVTAIFVNIFYDEYIDDLYYYKYEYEQNKKRNTTR